MKIYKFSIAFQGSAGFHDSAANFDALVDTGGYQWLKISEVLQASVMPSFLWEILSLSFSSNPGK